MSYTRKLINIAVLIAFGIILPVAFHFCGGAGSIFLPMHIPVLIAGLLLGMKGGLAVGVLTPLISSLTTGMPPLMPMLPVMAAELGTYGAVTGYLYRQQRLPLIWSLLGAMAVGRLVAGLTVAGMVAILGVNLKPLLFVIGAITTGLPGIVIQMLFVPLLVKRLEAVPGLFKAGENL
ncbi:hypothetical protein SRRS_10000 [Sporomusa rhizae]|uniref:ECF transporter S component n=1 Tax=Sporomusa rhizae TaxID=357999 RepID=UPI00352A9378